MEVSGFVDVSGNEQQKSLREPRAVSSFTHHTPTTLSLSSSLSSSSLKGVSGVSGMIGRLYDGGVSISPSFSLP